MMHVVHLTSVHSRYDTRIFIKECQSLAQKYRVSLVVADANGDERKNNIDIHDVGKPKNRIERIFSTSKRVFKQAKQLDADIYHLHDPELLLIALKLKKLGKHVVFDAHEDVPAQILSKPYLKPLTAKIIAFFVRYYEKKICSRIDGVIAATPYICNKFCEININTASVYNYPLKSELITTGKSNDFFKYYVCYVGGITEIRGILPLVKALPFVDKKYDKEKVLYLAGNFSDEVFSEKIKSQEAYSLVDELGYISRVKYREVLEKSIAGIVTFLPVANHINALPNKMFEYMSAGIAVIASNFSSWCEIIEGNQCGICVDPGDHLALAEAISCLLKDQKLARKMGENGRRAVEEKYNWEAESLKLFEFYRKIGGD